MCVRALLLITVHYNILTRARRTRPGLNDKDPRRVYIVFAQNDIALRSQSYTVAQYIGKKSTRLRTL